MSHHFSKLRLFYFIVFAISGFSGLIYESIWTHYLKLFLGHAAYAQTLVLVIFMMGMALGSWLASRYSHRLSNLLLTYALVEGIIGALAVAFHPTFISLTDLAFLRIIPQLDSASTVALFKWTLAALLILPQSVLLGMTFPLMSAGIIRRFPDTPGNSISILYFTNSLGAAIGILVSGFILVDIMGLPGTILTAGLINVLLALLVWGSCRYDTGETSPTDNLQNKSVTPHSTLFYGFLITAALTGTASFMYEIGWIRMLSLVLGSSTHAFELMLSAFILGLALGGYWIRKRIDTLVSPLKTLGFIQVIMGLLALSTLLLYGKSFDMMAYGMSAVDTTEEGYVVFNLFSHGLAMLIMIPTTFCAGMTLPLLTYYLVVKGHGEKSIGSIYAANTLGAIVGVVLSVQFIMPILGLKNVIIVGGSIDILLGIALLWYAKTAISRRRWLLVTSIALILLVSSIVGIVLDPVKMASGIFRSGQISQREVIYLQDGKTATVALSRIGDILSLSTNGKADAAIGTKKPTTDELTMVLLAAIPYAIYPEAKTAAVIGLGSGMTTNTLLTIPSLERIDTVEIEPAIIAGAKGFGKVVENTFSDPRSHIHIEDAKAYFTNHHKMYDLIISEPSNPWVSGVAGLFSEEFYRLIQNHINDNGLFVQWFHLYEIDETLVASVMKAISSHFADYVVYFPVESDMIIIAKKQGKLNEPTPNIFDVPKLKAELARIGVMNYQELMLHRVGSKQIFDPLISTYDIIANSDYFPVLDLGAVKTRFLNKKAASLSYLITIPPSFAEVLEQRPTRTEPINVSDKSIWRRGKDARQAMLICQYFQSIKKNEVPVITELSQENLNTVRNVRSLHYQCDVAELERNWLSHLKLLFISTAIFLSPQEMQLIWQDIENNECFPKFSVQIKQWVNLYKAVSQRDFAQIVQMTQVLLPAKEILPEPQNEYLLSVAMLANLVLQQPDAALDLWNRYVRPENPSVEHRLLVAILQKRLQK